MTADSPIPAAQYLRMSTDYQQYSLENQADAIAQYAEECGFSVVNTYTDAAKSGLRLKNRAGLKKLLKEQLRTLVKASVGHRSSNDKLEGAVPCTLSLDRKERKLTPA